MPGFSDNSKGALLMMGSMTAFTINDAFMKAISDDLPLFQAIFLRSAGVTALLWLLAWHQGALRLRIGRNDRRLIAIRAISEIGAAYFFISALFNMPIANATAIIQALPLTVTLAGAVFLGEAVGWRRVSAILVGLVGVLLIVQPGGEGFTVYSLYALAAVVCVTIRDLTARRMSQGLSSLSVALFTAGAVGASSGLASLTISWSPMDLIIWVYLSAAGLFVIFGYVFSVAAMRVGEIGLVAQFRYTSLLVALLLGVSVFGERPDALTLTGAAIVVATGLFTLYRERRAAQDDPAKPPGRSGITG